MTEKTKNILISTLSAALLVGVLLGNAYLFNNVGYPPIVDRFGEILFWVGIVFVIPPFFIFSALNKVGLARELQGRESFIQMNPGFWVFCFLFYILAIYLILRLIKKF